MILIDGKVVSEKIKADLKEEVDRLIDSGTDPHLTAILVGDDPPSQTYVRNKEKACQETGIISSVYRQPASMKEKELLAMIDFINNDPEVHGLIVQLPLPDHINPDRIIQHIRPENCQPATLGFCMRRKHPQDATENAHLVIWRFGLWIGQE